MATASFGEDYSKEAHFLRGGDETARAYSEWAHWSWVDLLKDTYRRASNMVALQRCGFVYSLPAAELQDMTKDSALVFSEQNSYDIFMGLVHEVVKCHVGLRLQYTSGCPLFLAGLLHPDAGLREQSMDLLKRLVESHRAAEKKASPTIQKILRGSPLLCTTMRFAAKFAEADKWGSPGPQLTDLVRALFKGFGQTKVIEDSVQTLRDRETRDGPAKNIAYFTQWEGLVHRKVLKAHGFNELQPEGGASVSPGFTVDRLFRPAHGNSSDGDSLELRKILGPQNWVTYNSVTIKQTWAAMQLIMHLSSKGDWSKADWAWYAGLLPEGHPVMDRNTGDAWLVIHTFDYAAVVWPLVRFATNLWLLDMSITALTWKCFFGHEELAVLSVQALCPLRVRLAGVDNLMDGPVFENSTTPAPLIIWQAKRGFAGVPEGIVAQLALDCGLPKVTAGALKSGQTVHQATVLMLMKLFVANLSGEMAMQILLDSVRASNKERAAYVHDLSEEAVQDCVLLQDQKVCKEFMDKIKVAKESYKKEHTSLKEMVVQNWPALAEKAETTRKNKAAERRAEAQLAKKVALWRATAETEPHLTIMKDKPAPAKVCVDHSNGRYQLTYRGYKRASFSWTERGSFLACQMALSKLWRWHEEATGEKPPPHLTLLPADTQ